MFEKLANVPKTPVMEKYSEMLADMTKEVGQALAIAETTTKNNTSSTSEPVRACLGAAASHLLLSSIATSGVVSPQLGIASTGKSSSLFPVHDETNVEDELSILTQLQADRKEALKELSEAVNILQSELAISRLSITESPSIASGN